MSRGYPLDINYLWTELSPFGVLRGGLYNGNGGADWKIGQPKATIWNAENLRSLPELITFAMELVNRDRTVNNLPPLQEYSGLSVKLNLLKSTQRLKTLASCFTLVMSALSSPQA